ncbi:hypothetical protein PMIN06_013179 [Paraphaeosphaeria minitans]
MFLGDGTGYAAFGLVIPSIVNACSPRRVYCAMRRQSCVYLFLGFHFVIRKTQAPTTSRIVRETIPFISRLVHIYLSSLLLRIFPLTTGASISNTTLSVSNLSSSIRFNPPISVRDGAPRKVPVAQLPSAALRRGCFVVVAGLISRLTRGMMSRSDRRLGQYTVSCYANAVPFGWTGFESLVQRSRSGVRLCM